MGLGRCREGRYGDQVREWKGKGDLRRGEARRAYQLIETCCKHTRISFGRKGKKGYSGSGWV